MSKHKKSRRYGRDAPQQRNATAGGVAMVTGDGWQVLCQDGYKPVAQCAEVQTCIGVYARLIASMTLRLMQNGEHGDIRIRDELSRRLDIRPHRYLTRSDFMTILVHALMETGNQVTLPIYRDGYLQELIPLAPGEVSLVAEGRDDYRVRYRDRVLMPDEVLHFRLNPDPNEPWRGLGYELALRDVVKSLRQSNATRQALKESPSPSIIVKVDGLTPEYRSPEGRKKLREEYIDSSDAGQPWFIPSEAFSVEQVRPLTMADLAIREDMELDKRAIAALMGVPPFVIGIGEFSQQAWQHFVSTQVMSLAREIEQVLTNGLLYSESRYWSFNARSLYNYALTDLVAAGKELVDRAAMRRNEWRDWLGLPPDAEMDELYLLENYLPTDRLGDQKKLDDPDDEPGDEPEGGDGNGEAEDQADADV